MKDVILYFPKVKSGGYIWCDDVMWTTDGERSTEKAYNILLEQCEFVRSVDNGGCILLRKR